LTEKSLYCFANLKPMNEHFQTKVYKGKILHFRILLGSFSTHQIYDIRIEINT